MPTLNERIEAAARAKVVELLTKKETFQEAARLFGVTDPNLIPTPEIVTELMNTPEGKMALQESLANLRTFMLIEEVAKLEARIEELERQTARST